jgi:hypothetical protein
MAGTRGARKVLSADGLVALVQASMARVADPRPGNPGIPLVDALMSAFAMFALRAPNKRGRGSYNSRAPSPFVRSS